MGRSEQVNKCFFICIPVLTLFVFLRYLLVILLLATKFHEARVGNTQVGGWQCLRAILWPEAYGGGEENGASAKLSISALLGL